MLSLVRTPNRRVLPLACTALIVRSAISTAVTAKPEGDISSVFVSLSGHDTKPLPQRFAYVKKRLIQGHEDQLRASWERLLVDLQEEVKVIAELGPKVVPQIDYRNIKDCSAEFEKEFKKRGVGLIRGVVPEAEALRLKEDIRQYVRSNPHTKAFPSNDPQVYELYWSPSQIRARSHPNLLAAQKFLMSFWHAADPSAPLSTANPTTYADRVRIRNPGDSGFALGPHVDGGGVERWEEGGYGLGQVYERIWEGKWEDYDPWEACCRLLVKSDLYNGAGACSMFRMFQGWLSMSTTGPNEGTLLVNPLLSRATAYYLLRPFFSEKHGPDSARFLSVDNWQLDVEPTTALHGATPSHCQELNTALHPHLDLDRTMVHIPTVRPGDYVAWHCDTIHAVDKVHKGKSDASVLYIPTCPLTESNAQYLVRQREAFLHGNPGPDFPGGKGESEHIGRSTTGHLAEVAQTEGMRAMGMAKWDNHKAGNSLGQKEVLRKANDILGF